MCRDWKMCGNHCRFTRNCIHYFRRLCGRRYLSLTPFRVPRLNNDLENITKHYRLRFVRYLDDVFPSAHQIRDHYTRNSYESLVFTAITRFTHKSSDCQDKERATIVVKLLSGIIIQYSTVGSPVTQLLLHLNYVQCLIFLLHTWPSPILRIMLFMFF